MRISFIKSIIAVGVVALTSVVAPTACQQAGVDPGKYEVIIDSSPGIVSSNNDILSYPALNVFFSGPISGERWQLSASIPGETPKIFSIKANQESECVLDFLSFAEKGVRQVSVTVTIEKSWDGTTLYSKIVPVTFQESVLDNSSTEGE